MVNSQYYITLQYDSEARMKRLIVILDKTT